MGSVTETELVEASGFKPGKSKSRQDFLAALARAVAEIPEDDYDNVSNKAASWYEKAVKALKAKTDIPDFEDADIPNGVDPNPDDEVTEEPEEEVEEEKPAKAEAEKPKKKLKQRGAGKAKTGPDKPIEDYAKITGEKDKFGVTMGPKTADAIKMYEKGATPSDVSAQLGGRYYNILKRLGADGHKVLKDGHVVTLIHKDDFGKKAKGK